MILIPLKVEEIVFRTSRKLQVAGRHFASYTDGLTLITILIRTLEVGHLLDHDTRYLRICSDLILFVHRRTGTCGPHTAHKVISRLLSLATHRNFQHERLLLGWPEARHQ
jgi:hypothetical protein